MSPNFTSVKSNMNWTVAREPVRALSLALDGRLQGRRRPRRQGAFPGAVLALQVYFNSSLTYGLMKLFRVNYQVAAPTR